MFFFIVVHRIKTKWLITAEHQLATILHPKLKNFQCCSDEKENAISELKLAFDQFQLNVPSAPSSSSSSSSLNSNQATSTTSSDINTNAETLKSTNLLAQCFDLILYKSVETRNPHQQIDDYLNSEFSNNQDDIYSQDGDIDVLSYWREKQKQFPVLSCIAKQIFAIPASNTIAERLFSTSKNIISEKRTNLGSEKVNQLLFLQKNLTMLKQLFNENENRRKRTISMSSTNTVSSEDSTSTCTTPKQSKFDDDENYNTLGYSDIFIDD